MSRFGPQVQLEDPAYVHPSAQVYGRVTMGPGSSLWINSAIRAEHHAVQIGAYTNIQDFVMVHIGAACGTRIGDYCSVAHHATIHGATIGDDCLIGVGAVVMDGAVVGANSIVAPGAVVREGAEFPPGSIIAGVPAALRKARNCWIANRLNALWYHHNALAYARDEHRAWDSDEFRRFHAEQLKALKQEFGLRFG